MLALPAIDWLARSDQPVFKIRLLYLDEARNGAEVDEAVTAVMATVSNR